MDHKVIYMFIGFEFYPIYHYKIDLFYYLSDKKKQATDYYFTSPDLSQEEMDHFLSTIK